MFKIKAFFIVIIATSGFLAFSSCDAEEATKSNTITSSFAAVNGIAIPQSRFDSLLKETIAQGQTDTPELRKGIREVLINQEIILQKAQQSGIDKTQEFKNRLELSRQQVLISSYLRDYTAAHPIPDEDVKKEFDRIATQMGDMEYKVRHILVKEEDEAKNIIAKLKKKISFESLAEKSLDPGSKANGGDLGWAPAGNYVMPFADAVKHLKKGEITESPIHTTLGWHVIRLDDTRPVKILPFEQVKANLLQKMQQAQIEKMIADLRATTKIE